MAARWNAKPVAEEIAQLILDGKEDPRIKWNEEGDRVQIQTRLIIPDYDSSFAATRGGRRTRLFKELEKILLPEGWVRKGGFWEKA